MSGLGKPTAREAALTILNEVGVATVPGTAFYSSGGGQNLVRLCYAKEFKDLEMACERLRGLGRS